MDGFGFLSSSYLITSAYSILPRMKKLKRKWKNDNIAERLEIKNQQNTREAFGQFTQLCIVYIVLNTLGCL